ncbi:MAG: nucleotidyltransferase family protein [Cyanobacteria bacterium]|uniref:nucleotidyltransferase family protein n=1 Tax=Geminocystis sp. TaxID=2664100 RepID=UPI001D6DE510|nr:nucleotidyltransferase family protein [Cyanobacteria bacterium CG_2015-16_32_12]NCO78637.1 nucleotidyltransferase family protein [Cyanobacteria bacterium CG_2015-22_32_23]NCQ03358.1 nucleotidyltransferase family protein [Cyanobacteria bacterium CG_2015-09_32_10]NCQ41819.1 nucleotidyltransferase family protein [Cyanobacteria bacterium CG_2015-04_32_10]NCS85985.1 nucleotidyltransferase family protein [Cyanobacteria bacterium CG_2015-02_32_10]
MRVLLKSKQDIFLQLQTHQKTLENYGVKRCGLFGSFQRGEATENSDIDLLVEFKSELKTFMNFMDLCFFLEDLFERKVDVLTPESLSPYLRDIILGEVEYVSFR